LTSVEGEVLTKPNRIRFTTTARRRQWHRNCVAVGLSGGFRTAESTSIHLIQRAVLRIIRMLPGGPISARDVAEFNDQQLTDMEQVRDFLILHYKATERRDSPFWRQCAAMEVPTAWPTGSNCSAKRAACSARTRSCLARTAGCR
jgi:tryptophan halogenase